MTRREFLAAWDSARESPNYNRQAWVDAEARLSPQFRRAEPRNDWQDDVITEVERRVERPAPSAG